MTDERDPTPITGKWGKQKQYKCRLCAFDSLDRAAFIEHFRRAHPPLRIIDGGKAGDPPAVTNTEETNNGAN